MLRPSPARRSICRQVQTPRRRLGFGSGLAAARSGQDISALLRKRDGLDCERARILLLVVADDVGQLAFRDPRGIADLRHRDGLGEAVLDGLDLGLVAFYRDLVEFAVALDQQQAVTEGS